MKRTAWTIGAVFAGVVTFLPPASAAPIFSQTGTFANDETVDLFQFTLTVPTDLIARTYGYAGGTMANGTVIAAGGFNSDLALYAGSGPAATLVASNDASIGNPLPPFSSFGACGANAVSVATGTGLAGDACLHLSLGAGTYTLAVSEYDNSAIGPTLGAGFFENVTDPNDPRSTAFFGCSNGQFCDAGGNDRSNAFAVDVAAVPEPGTLSLLGLGLAALGVKSLRRRS